MIRADVEDAIYTLLLQCCQPSEFQDELSATQLHAAPGLVL